MYRINEIFYSIQGEGFWTGTPMIFIRFSGCNLECSYCDTNHWSYTEYDIRKILLEIDRYPSARICLTGGEPTLQNLEPLIEALHKNHYLVHIETNGTNRINHLDFDWVTVSPKKGQVQKRGDEIKIIYQGQKLGKYMQQDFKYFYLQPCSMKNIPETIEKVKEEPKWNLSLQIQKFIKIP